MTCLHELVSEKRQLLRELFLIRAGDLREERLLRQGRGWIHIPGQGHEALAALAAALEPEDLLFLYYRDRALMQARGVTPLEMAREHLATAKSSSGGRQMPVHGSYRRLGIYPPATPTASQCLPAVGAAWGIKLKGDRRVVLCTIGDASTRQGEFFEAVVQAVQDRLPIVFVVEDNGYGISTPTLDQLPFQCRDLSPCRRSFRGCGRNGRKRGYCDRATWRWPDDIVGGTRSADVAYQQRRPPHLPLRGRDRADEGPRPGDVLCGVPGR
jgi:TPP-dependent pyruvate/acetoin dehydrogenase alpha subunit